MAKTSGLGDNFYVAGYDLSGDINSLKEITASADTLDMTGIDKSAMERVKGQSDGKLSFTSYFNVDAGQQHEVLKALPDTDTHLMYARGTTLGSPAACIVSKRTSYEGSREDDGGFKFDVEAVGSGYGLEWGRLLTAGIRTDTDETDGDSIDTAASASFGAQAYLQVFDFDGTDVEISIEDSADDNTFAAVTDLVFTEITASNSAERVFTSSGTATVKRYVRAVTTTSEGFNSVDFAVVLVKNAAVVTF